jgi:hypothetical protein
MKKLIVVFKALALLGSTAFADWEEADGHKMHYPQLPDPTGWDVLAAGIEPQTGGLTLADDWECGESGWVKDIHFWGSWRYGVESDFLMFHITIHENIAEGPHGWSCPGAQLWPAEGPYEVFDPPTVGPIDPPGMQGWFNPATGEYYENDHDPYYQYNVFLPEEFWFWQEAGEIYWLRVAAYINYPEDFSWGWKTSISPQFMDDAVWAYAADEPNYDWIELREPIINPDPIINAFWATFDATGYLLQGSGEGAFDDQWFYYPNTGWWNVWFYDHPFDPERYKEIFVTVNVLPIGPGGFLTLAVNWSTPFWPPGYPTPPIPPLSPPEEEEFIGRQIIWEGPVEGPMTIDDIGFIIPDYNPEWVSIDVMGTNIEIEPASFISHACLAQGGGESLDLAFVITGGSDEIPTLSEWGMILLALLLLAAGTFAILRRRRAVTASK